MGGDTFCDDDPQLRHNSHRQLPSGHSMLVASAMAWLSVLGTLGALLVALALGLGLGDWARRPKLVLHSDRDNPSDRVVTPDLEGRDVGFLRIRVENRGRSTARDVQLSVGSVDQWVERTNRWRRVRPELDGRPLKWGGSAQPILDVPPNVERPVDLLAITRDLAHQGAIPMTIFIQGEPPANRANDLPPGGWRIRLMLSADNSRAELYEVSVMFDGTWPAERVDQIWDAVVVRGPDRTPSDDPPP
jgi:hypothetical protein